MLQDFLQKTIFFNPEDSKPIQVESLLKLIENHPYKDQICEELKIDLIINDLINIGNINTSFKAVQNTAEFYHKLNINAELKDIEVTVKEFDEVSSVEFAFEEYRVVDDY